MLGVRSRTVACCDETFFKKSETQVCCDSNSQCYNLFEDVNGGDMLYDPEKRTLKQGEDTYQFDTSGRLVKISDAAGFESAAYFRRVFRAATGKTPSEYRKSAIEL